jgi:hypothetical protein
MLIGVTNVRTFQGGGPSPGSASKYFKEVGR